MFCKLGCISREKRKEYFLKRNLRNIPYKCLIHQRHENKIFLSYPTFSFKHQHDITGTAHHGMEFLEHFCTEHQ